MRKSEFPHFSIWAIHSAALLFTEPLSHHRDFCHLHLPARLSRRSSCNSVASLLPGPNETDSHCVNMLSVTGWMRLRPLQRLRAMQPQVVAITWWHHGAQRPDFHLDIGASQWHPKLSQETSHCTSRSSLPCHQDSLLPHKCMDWVVEQRSCALLTCPKHMAHVMHMCMHVWQFWSSGVAMQGMPMPKEITKPLLDRPNVLQLVMTA